MKYAWIKRHTTEFPVDVMCRFLGVSRSAYYAWLQRTQTSAEQADAELTDRIQNLFKASPAYQDSVITPGSKRQPSTDRSVDACRRFGL